MSAAVEPARTAQPVSTGKPPAATLTVASAASALPPTARPASDPALSATSKSAAPAQLTALAAQQALPLLDHSTADFVLQGSQHPVTLAAPANVSGVTDLIDQPLRAEVAAARVRCHSRRVDDPHEVINDEASRRELGPQTAQPGKVDKETIRRMMLAELEDMELEDEILSKLLPLEERGGELQCCGMLDCGLGPAIGIRLDACPSCKMIGYCSAARVARV